MAWREAVKKPVARPTAPKPKFDTKDDDWETDITYENQTNEKAQRYGSNSMPGTGRVDHVDFKGIQEKMKTADNTVKQVYQEKNPNKGYGGKYGTDQVMDKSAADYTYRANVAKHSSQTDGKKGFGGAYGVDEHAKDKSAVGFDYKAEVEKHPSQTDFSKGFGGKFGTDQNAQDKSAVGFAHREVVEKHPSQKDYNVGFGGKYGVQKEEPSRLPSSNSPTSERKSPEKPVAPVGSSIGVGNIRARFENMKKEQEEEAARRVAEERNKRASHDQQSASNGNGHAKPKQPEAPLVSSPPPPAALPRSASPPPASVQISNPSIYQNLGHQFANEPTSPSEEKKEEINQYVGNVNVSSLLRQRKGSSSSSKNEEEDEWAEDHHSSNQYQPSQQRNPSPIPAANHSSNEGIKCIARYGYQKIEDDELGFEENEIITNVQRMHDEWWFGKIGVRSGLFPANYVEEIE